MRTTSITIVAVIVVLLFSAGATAGTISIDYTVATRDLSGKQLDVRMAIRGLPKGETLRLRGIPTYVDNPTTAARTLAATKIAAVTTSGKMLEVRHISDGTREIIYLVDGLDVEEVIVTYQVNVDFVHSKQTEVYRILLPYMNEDRAWLYGNNTFITPVLADDRRFSLRVPVDVAVSVEVPDGIGIAGIPDGRIELKNLYELMSLQFGLGSFVKLEGNAAGVNYETIFRDEKEFSEEERDHLHRMTKEMIEVEVDFWGGAPFEYFGMFYFRSKNGTGGLESSNVCQNYTIEDVDVTDGSNRNVQGLYGVAVHELFHTWNPIYLMAIEDPWIKEGVSSYYDTVLGARLEYTVDAPDSAWGGYFDMIDENARMGGIALTDPELWDNEYEGFDWTAISYARGAVVALLLDLHLREHSNNTKSLDDVMRMLYARYVHVGYTHEQLLATIDDATGVDARAFFAEYVEGTRLATRKEVLAAVARAKELGVFAR